MINDKLQSQCDAIAGSHIDRHHGSIWSGLPSHTNFTPKRWRLLLKPEKTKISVKTLPLKRY